MSGRILDGRATAATIKDELRERIAELARRRFAPGLGTVLVGDDPGSRAYVRGKHRDSAEVGIESIEIELPATASQAEIEEVVDGLNANPACTGYIVQLPLPVGIDTERILELIAPHKDADGLHPVNLGRLAHNLSAPLTSPVPCTPRGIVELLRRYDIDLRGTEVVVVGRGITVGRPLGLLLTRRPINATVTLCHTGTKDLAAHTRRAEVLIVAAGVPGVVTGDMVAPGAVVVDVGITRVQDEDTGRTHLVGDVAPEVRDVADWLAPVPGGVGPMTRAMLLSNVVEMAERELD